jgi:ribonuclease-3
MPPTDGEPSPVSDSASDLLDSDPRVLDCERRIRYFFRTPSLLLRALTHASATSQTVDNYERLEFLGDAVLDVVISEILFERFPEWREGELTEVRARVVNRETLAEIGAAAGLDACLVTGAGVTGRKPLPGSVIAGCFEAVIGAVYLDGGLDAARTVIRHLAGAAVTTAALGGYDRNYKAKLQEYAQSTQGVTPSFRLLASEGPEHGKTFLVAAAIGDEEVGRGRGKSKKEAEREAARDALARLEVDGVGGE